MATKKADKVKKDVRIDFKDIKWVIDNLTKDHMKVYDADPPNEAQIIDAINNMVEVGCKVGVKFDTYSGKGILATAIFDVGGYENSGYAISARGTDVHDALGILVFKFFTVAQSDLSLWDYGKDEGFKRG